MNRNYKPFTKSFQNMGHPSTKLKSQIGLFINRYRKRVRRYALFLSGGNTLRKHHQVGPKSTWEVIRKAWDKTWMFLRWFEKMK